MIESHQRNRESFKLDTYYNIKADHTDKGRRQQNYPTPKNENTR